MPLNGRYSAIFHREMPLNGRYCAIFRREMPLNGRYCSIFRREMPLVCGYCGIFRREMPLNFLHGGIFCREMSLNFLHGGIFCQEMLLDFLHRKHLPPGFNKLWVCSVNCVSLLNRLAPSKRKPGCFRSSMLKEHYLFEKNYFLQRPGFQYDPLFLFSHEPGIHLLPSRGLAQYPSLQA